MKHQSTFSLLFFLLGCCSVLFGCKNEIDDSYPLPGGEEDRPNIIAPNDSVSEDSIPTGKPLMALTAETLFSEGTKWILSEKGNTNEMHYSYYFLEGKEEIEGHECYKYWQSDDEANKTKKLKGFIYVEDEKVYYYAPASESESCLIYDFNIGVGDTVCTNLIWEETWDVMPVNLVCHDVDHLVSRGYEYEVLVMKDGFLGSYLTTYWLRGLGGVYFTNDKRFPNCDFNFDLFDDRYCRPDLLTIVAQGDTVFSARDLWSHYFYDDNADVTNEPYVDAFKEGTEWRTQFRKKGSSNYETEVVTIEGECLVGGRTCMKVWRSVGKEPKSLYAYFYKEGEKIFWIPADGSVEGHLLYDFGLEPDETFRAYNYIAYQNQWYQTNEPLHYWYRNNGSHIIDYCGKKRLYEIDEYLFDSDHPYYCWPQKITWIRGIGSRTGLFRNCATETLGEDLSTLSSVIVDGVPIWENGMTR